MGQDEANDVNFITADVQSESSMRRRVLMLSLVTAAAVVVMFVLISAVGLTREAGGEKWCSAAGTGRRTSCVSAYLENPYIISLSSSFIPTEDALLCSTAASAASLNSASTPASPSPSASASASGSVSGLGSEWGDGRCCADSRVLT